MRTRIHDDLSSMPEVQEADAILRKCVHCGFCTATCPTYQLLGDELDGPRGRIYLIKNLLEENRIGSDSVRHLDRCLTCRACETTCPSGVEYGRLLDVGRELVSDRVKRPLRYHLLAGVIRFVVPRRWLFQPLLMLGQLFRPLLPRALAAKIPRVEKVRTVANISTGARTLLLGGCVQSVATPNVNVSLMSLLAAHGVEAELVDHGCCGALDLHLSAHDTAKTRMRGLIDRLDAQIEGVDAIISSATGCGVTIKDYPSMFKHDPLYHERAKRIAEKVVDAAEFMEGHEYRCRPARVAVQTPCTMQHGLKLTGRIENILSRSGFTIVPVKEGHLCCGSAGTYSYLQPELAAQLLSRKVSALEEADPDVIVTANIGCQLHLASGAKVPVKHWVELLSDELIG